MFAFLSVDGVFEEWGEWGACSVSCSTGTQIRKRACAAPIHGGRECNGNFDDNKECWERHCPGGSLDTHMYAHLSYSLLYIMLCILKQTHVLNCVKKKR